MLCYSSKIYIINIFDAYFNLVEIENLCKETHHYETEYHTVKLTLQN